MAARAVEMVGMEGSAVLAVSKVVVEARVARAGAGSARVVCVDGGSAGCGSAGCGRACCGRAGCDRVLRRHPANDVTSSSSHTSPVVTQGTPRHSRPSQNKWRGRKRVV